MTEPVEAIPPEKFAEAWNGAVTLPEAVALICALAKKSVPRWAVMARAAAVRKEGVELKKFGMGDKND
jgi:hypothetical protein